MIVYYEPIVEQSQQQAEACDDDVDIHSVLLRFFVDNRKFMHVFFWYVLHLILISYIACLGLHYARVTMPLLISVLILDIILHVLFPIILAIENAKTVDFFMKHLDVCQQ